MRSDRLAAELRQAILTLNRGIWLGLLDDEGIATASDIAYASWSRYRSEEHNLAGLFPWEQAVVERYFAPAARVLVLAAGAGREVIALAERGYTVVGLDPSAELVAIGARLIEERGLHARLLQSPPNELPPLDLSFDAVLVGWGGYTHVPGTARRVRLLRRIHDVLPRDSPVVLSFFIRDPESRSHRAALHIARSIQRLRRSATVSELGDAVDGTFDHHFTWDEIRAEIEAAGLRSVAEYPSPYAHVVAVTS